jgi:hypothetical protein
LGGCPDRLKDGERTKKYSRVRMSPGLSMWVVSVKRHHPVSFSRSVYFCPDIRPPVSQPAGGVVHLPVLSHSSLCHIVDFHGLCYNGVIHRGKFRQLSQIQKRVQHGQRYVTQYVIVAYHICNVKANAPFFIAVFQDPKVPNKAPKKQNPNRNPGRCSRTPARVWARLCPAGTWPCGGHSSTRISIRSKCTCSKN